MKIKWIMGEEGVAAVIMAVCLVMFLGFIALVVDLGYLLTARTQLYRTADASALAATANLDGTLAGIAAARNAAIAYAVKNQATGDPVILQPDDIEFGFWDMPAKAFLPILPGAPGYPQDINAVRVTARREASRGTALATTFARVLGENHMDVNASAVAQKGGPSQCVDSNDPALDCNLDVPIVLCSNAITQVDGSPNCGVEITVGDTPGQSGAWTSFFTVPANTPNIKSFVDGDTPSVYARPCSLCPADPEIDNRTHIEINNGSLTPVFNKMRDKYLEKVADPCDDPTTCEDSDGDGIREWVAYVAVACIDCQDPSTMNGPVCVTGFAKFNIEEVCTAGTLCNRTGNTADKAIYGFLKCGDLDRPNGGTGGPNFGTVSPIPGLVQ